MSTTYPTESTLTSSGGTVLVVDDDAAVRLFHQWVLELDGYEVIPAADGGEALEHLEGNDIDLVLLDSRMPGLSGLDVLRTVRADGRGVPIMLVTGATDLDDRIAGLDDGADAYLAKPVGSKELRSHVRALMRGRRSAIDGATDRGRLARRERAMVEAVLDTRSYHPVFQPVVSLRDRSTVAFEALTRFDDGQAPDLRFAEAERSGLGIDLEMATLDASINAARRLPAGIPLHVNISPGLLTHSNLCALLATSDRPIVVELTEHDPIDDYPEVSRALVALGDDVRVAVDDAGAGYASLIHILSLDPDLVKLDREFIRDIDADLARRALVAGIVSFAGATGTLLIAEGVEREDEAHALTDLGVILAQGYLFGRPTPL